MEKKEVKKVVGRKGRNAELIQTERVGKKVVGRK